jgi:predicted Fe-S protein YdhL (DUF1289 family)
VLFRKDRHSRHNLYGIKNESFCVGCYRPIQKIATWCRLLMSADTKKQFLETKRIEPRSGPCSPLSMTLRRKQLRPSPRSRPEVKHATKRWHLLVKVEVNWATMPPKRRRLLCRGLQSRACLPSCDGMEGGGEVTLPLDANNVTMPMC